MMRVEDIESNNDITQKANPAGRLQYLPAEERRCQNIWWLLLLVIFLGGSGVIAYAAITSGNVYRLMYPGDSSGQLCGFGSSQSEFTFLYYIDPGNQQSTTVCVNSCPSQNAIPASESNTICVGRISVNKSAFTQLSNDGKCAKNVYASRPVLKRCVPNNLTGILNSNNSDSGLAYDLQNYFNIALLIVSDFSYTWMSFLVFAGISILVSLVWLAMMQVSARFTVFLLLFAGMTGSNGLGIFLYFAWAQSVLDDDQSTVRLISLRAQRQTFFIAFIVFVSLAGVLDLMAVWFFKQIRVMIKLMREVSYAVRSMPALTVFPFWSFAITTSFFAYWVIIQLLLASATNIQTVSCDNVFCNQRFLYYSQIYHLFGVVWMYQFFSGINQMTIAGALETWYWTEDKRSLKKLPIMRSLHRVLRYHLGSVAAGSLWLILLFFIRAPILLMSSLFGFKEKRSRMAGSCCAALYAPIRLANSSAYIEAALHGECYRQSAKRAFDLFARNGNRLAFINKITSFVMFIAKLFIAGASGVGSYYWFKYWYAERVLNYTAVSVLIVMIITFSICSLFMQVYEYGIDVIFLCICHDLEFNEDKNDWWPLMSKELQMLTNVKNLPTNTNKVNPESTEKTVAMRQAFVDDL